MKISIPFPYYEAQIKSFFSLKIKWNLQLYLIFVNFQMIIFLKNQNLLSILDCKCKHFANVSHFWIKF